MLTVCKLPLPFLCVADEEEAEQPTSSGDKNHDEQEESDGEFSDKDVEESE